MQPGHRLEGRYELLYPYAQGGMATVWVARIHGKHGFEKLVAVKTMLPELTSHPGFRAMFLDEAKIAARISHPNVAGIVDLGEEGDVLYMVLEWIDGDSWSKLAGAIAAAGHAFPLPALLRIAADTCLGLHAAHELRDENGQFLSVVHRDVSPQNVLLSTNGLTKVIDFGIAKAVDRLAEQTQTGMHKGKAQYTAPEQVKSRMRVDRRADIWAVGTMMYQYLAGRLPYAGKTDMDILVALTKGKPPPPLPASVPPPVADVVMRALAHAPEQRFSTALEMARAIETLTPAPCASHEIAQLMAQYLAPRIAERKRDIADAVAEVDAKLGRPRRASVAPPPSAPEPAGASSPFAALVRDSEKVSLRGPVSSLSPGSALASGAPQPSFAPWHWAVMIVAVLVPVAVWTLVIYTALFAPLTPASGRRANEPGVRGVSE